MFTVFRFCRCSRRACTWCSWETAIPTMERSSSAGTASGRIPTVMKLETYINNTTVRILCIICWVFFLFFLFSKTHGKKSFHIPCCVTFPREDVPDTTWCVGRKSGERAGGRERCTVDLATVHPRALTMPRRSTSGFHRSDEILGRGGGSMLLFFCASRTARTPTSSKTRPDPTRPDPIFECIRTVLFSFRAFCTARIPTSRTPAQPNPMFEYVR